MALIRNLDEVMALVGIVLILLIPILAILTHHQRKMAELVRMKDATGSQDVRSELSAISDTLRTQSKALEALLNERETERRQMRENQLENRMRH